MVRAHVRALFYNVQYTNIQQACVGNRETGILEDLLEVCVVRIEKCSCHMDFGHVQRALDASVFFQCLVGECTLRCCCCGCVCVYVRVCVVSLSSPLLSSCRFSCSHLLTAHRANMPKAKTTKKVVPASAAKAAGGKKVFEKNPKNFGIGELLCCDCACDCVCVCVCVCVIVCVRACIL